jgi:predicted nucleic acid-binding protein
LFLVDTSVWIDHLRGEAAWLPDRLAADEVLAHAFVLGELALGSLHDREAFIAAYSELPSAVVAEDHEVMSLISNTGLAGSGIGWVDAHLLAATLLTNGARLVTRDRRLRQVAGRAPFLGYVIEPS